MAINNEDKGDSYTNIPFDKPKFLEVCLNKKIEIVEISKFN